MTATAKTGLIGSAISAVLGAIVFIVLVMQESSTDGGAWVFTAIAVGSYFFVMFCAFMLIFFIGIFIKDE
tara:strand:+ start:68 stop:277 length:210 start_codon:yes stop_codon:yes gene_type:complete